MSVYKWDLNLGYNDKLSDFPMTSYIFTLTILLQQSGTTHSRRRKELSGVLSQKNYV